MRSFSAAGAVLLAAIFAGHAETAATFEDVSRRAQQAVDSDPVQAVTLFRQALALQPSWAEGWLYLGGDLYQLNRYGEAREALRKGLELTPEKGTGWGLLGLSDYELGDLDRALANIQKAEELGLGDNHAFEAAVRQRAALALIRASAFDEALEQLKPVTKFGESSPAIITAAGLCALTMPRNPSELTPAQVPLVNLAGSALWANMSRRPADAAYRELISTYPNEPGVHYAYGVFLMEVDQHAALAEFQKELQANASHWPSLLVTAFLQTREGSPEAAIPLAEQAIRTAPERNRWIAHTALGYALLSMGDLEKAIPELEIAKKTEPANASIRFYLERAYRQAGRKDDAQREKTEFLRLKQQQDPLSLPGAVTGMIAPSQ